MIEEGDWEANFAYYALHKLHILPSAFLGMDEQEKIFVIAAIEVKMEKDKEKKKELERQTSKI